MQTDLFSGFPANPEGGNSPQKSLEGDGAEPAASDKFLELLLHQMPQKIQHSLEGLLQPAVALPNRARHTAASNPEVLFPIEAKLEGFSDTSSTQEERWHRQWSADCTSQVQRSLASCWQLFRDLGLSYLVRYRYFANCYRASSDCLESEKRGDFRILLRSEYPQSLQDLGNRAPRLLFWQGSPLAGSSTAIIGTRRADPWALHQARQEAILLQKRKLGSHGSSAPASFEPATEPHWIISGLAHGCDSAAHQGALEAGGPTLAVLPGGFCSIYPKHNENLARQIVAEGGALVSEYVPDAAVLPWRFIQRDRLQSALAQRLLLVESPEGGGSMHAVETARQLGRPIYVLDGSERCWQLSAAGSLKGILQCQLLDRSLEVAQPLLSGNYSLLQRQWASLWSQRKD